jgi:hypothetical protein
MAEMNHRIAVLMGLTLASCAPKAVIVQEDQVVPRQAQESVKVPEPVAAETEIASPTLPAGEGLRPLKNMLDLPSEAEFRTAAPAGQKPGGGAGAVISRPPTEPPSRTKPKEEVPEPQR